ncbi:TIGR00730 family Rossman fold protein [Devosia sp. 2618]|uniref:LOG family protein n=1 Tax=Devosia sp. 2618 TaxID=3156454 RepID=UPI0033976DD3
MSTIRSICVYCGSSPGNDPAYLNAGEQLGAAIAAANIKLIFGGGTNGIMGAVARGVLQAGGEVGAIIPRFLTTRETTHDAMKIFNDLTIVETMHERKQSMFDRSDAFVALPGGLGTVEEIIEIMTWAQLGQHRKPIVFANVKNFWAPMLGMIDHMERVGFLHSRSLIQPIVVDEVENIVAAIQAAAVPEATAEGVSSVIEKM